MFKTKSILSQLQVFISRYDFEKSIFRHNGDKGIKTFSTRDLLKVMIFSHLTAMKSLRDICDSLHSKKNHWYHFGLKSLSRNNLSHSLKKRSNQIFEETFYKLLSKVQKAKGPSFDKRFRFKNKLKTIDTTTISLCLSLYDWAKFRKAKGGIKVHTVFDNKTQLPEFVDFTNAKRHDTYLKNELPISQNSIYVMDKAYLDFDFLNKIHKNKAFFVIRTKTNTQYRKIFVNKRKTKNIRADWKIKLTGIAADDFQENLRLVKYYDQEKKCIYEYLTNNFQLSAITIADIYKSRWDIELFFKWIKQQLKIKTFIGTSENAVKIQIWSAMIVYLLVKYLKFLSRTSFSLLKIFRVLRNNIFEGIDLLVLLKPPGKSNSKIEFKNDNQLCLNF